MESALEAAVRELKNALPDRTEDDAARLYPYSFDASHLARKEPRVPTCVVLPKTAEEVETVVRIAARHRVPLIPRGAGTAQTAGALVVDGGVVVDLSAMDRILEVDVDNLQVVVEPGVIPEDLNRVLAPKGFFFPPDPGSVKMCTLGGMVANNTSGMRAVKYGTTKNYVLGLEVVLADGTRIVTGGARSRALKSVSGYDLTGLMVGSEGTLGIITRIRLKVIPIPESQGLIMATFSDVERAGRGVQGIFSARMVPSAIEIMDSSALKAVSSYRPDLDIPQAEAMLLIEMDGLPGEVAAALDRASDVLKEWADRVSYSQDPEECANLWAARRALRPASGRLAEGASLVSAGEDIGVPMARVPEALTSIHQVLRETGVMATVYGHVGDGNLHVALLAFLEDEDSVLRAEEAADRLHLLALQLDGTTTAEHGVGVVRAGYMEREHGDALEVMRTIKKTLDPDGIMNPGKMGV